MRSANLYTTMEHPFLSQKETLTVFRSFFRSLIFKRNIDHRYINFLFLNFPASKCSWFVLFFTDFSLVVLIKFVFICGWNKLQIIFFFFLFFWKFGLSVFYQAVFWASHVRSIYILCQEWMTKSMYNSLHKKKCFPERIYSVNVIKSAGNCGFGHIY